MSDFQLPLADEMMSFDDTVIISDRLHLQPALVLPNLRTECWQYQFLKRLIDLCGALGLLSLTLIPCLAIAIALKLTTDEPIFYQEWRLGRRGRPFRIFKFRSMCSHTQFHANRDGKGSNLLHWRTNKDGHDPRITPVGRFLRQWSLDELPQLINVLLGEMSLVGPRPVVEAEIPLYGTMCHYYYAATPGLSGLWQVSGRSNIGFQHRVILDASYVQNWSLWSDCKILIKTVPTVFRRTGAR